MKPLVVFFCFFLVISSSASCYFDSTYSEQHTLISNKVVSDKVECTQLCTDDDTCVAVSLVSRDGKSLCALLGGVINEKFCTKATVVLEKQDCTNYRIVAGYFLVVEPADGHPDTSIVDGLISSQAYWPTARKIKVTVDKGCSISIECADGTKINFDEPGYFNRDVPNGFIKATATCK